MTKTFLYIFLCFATSANSEIILASTGDNLDVNQPGPAGACARISVACLDDTGCFHAINDNRDECHKAERNACIAAEAAALHSSEWEKIKAHFDIRFTDDDNIGWAGMLGFLHCKSKR